MSFPAPRRRRSLGAGSAGVLLLLAGGLLTGCGGGDGATAAPAPSSPASSSTGDGSYGGDPTFLPSDTLGSGFAHRVVDASASHPALATQGDTVRVHVGSTAALATVTGPAVPVEGQPYQAPASPATWHVVVTGVKGGFRLDPGTFQGIDEDGHVYDLRTHATHGAVPRTVGPGRTARFDLFSPGFATGEGRMRWIPRGHLAPVEWDFVVETD